MPSRVSTTWRLVGSSLPGRTDGDPSLGSWPQACRIPGSPLERASFFLDEIDEASAVILAVRSSPLPARRQIPPAQSWTMRIPEDVEAFWSGFGRKARYNIQRNARRLGGTLHRVTTPDQMEWFCRAAERVARRSWQAEALGPRISASEVTISRLEKEARAGIARHYLLQVGDVPVAFVLGIIGDGVMYYEEIGYDQEFGKLSPGTVLLTLIVEDLILSGVVGQLDFGLGDAPYKRQFATDSLTRGRWVLPASPAERLVWWIHERGVVLRGIARRLVAHRKGAREQQAKSPPHTTPGPE